MAFFPLEKSLLSQRDKGNFTPKIPDACRALYTASRPIENWRRGTIPWNGPRIFCGDCAKEIETQNRKPEKSAGILSPVFIPENSLGICPHKTAQIAALENQ
jgi:hypothetical protein